MDNRIITTDVMEEDFFPGGKSPSSDPGRIHWSGKDQKHPEDLYRSCQAAPRFPGSRPFLRPSGLGKTTLSGIIANEMGVHMKVTSGPAIEKPGEMAAILNNLQEGDILLWTRSTA